MLLSSFVTKIPGSNHHIVGKFAASSSLTSLPDMLDASVTSSTTIISNNIFDTTSSLLLNYGFTKPWWEDDLPNILGINPLEAAIIFGALYYLYGIDALYDFARDAGKTFSTVTPIIKQVVGDIYDEFKDYLEENQERENLRKAGLDIDNLPRTTTNIIERFMDNYNAYEESLKADNESGSGSSGDNIDRTVDSSFMSDIDTDADTGLVDTGLVAETVEEKRRKISQSKKRLTKKEMLKEKKDETTTTTTSGTTFEAEVDDGSNSNSNDNNSGSSINPADLNSFYPTGSSSEVGLDSTITMMNEMKTEMETAAPAEGEDVMLQSMKDSTFYDDNVYSGSNEFDNKEFPDTPIEIPLGLEDLNLNSNTDGTDEDNLDDVNTSTSTGAATAVATDASAASNRFLQQISGQWNSDVLKMEQEATSASSAVSSSSDSDSSSSSSSSTSFGFDDFNSEFYDINNPNLTPNTNTNEDDIVNSELDLDMSKFDHKFDLDAGLDEINNDLVPDVDVDLNQPFPIMVRDGNANTNADIEDDSSSIQGVYINSNYNATATESTSVSAAEIKDVLVKLDEIDREYKMLRSKLITIIENSDK